MDIRHKDYNLSHLQARVVARLLRREFPHVWHGLLETLVEKLQNEDEQETEFVLHALQLFLEAVEEEQEKKLLHKHIARLVPALFSAMVSDAATSRLREKVLAVFHLCLQAISWADGKDPQVLEACLSEHFNQWIALFTQIIQANPRQFFDVKRNALRCLTVIFRDFINYSKECINMILKPAWKLLNIHLPVFTEALGYGANLSELRDEDDDEEGERGYESDEEEEVFGVEGMTLHLIELLTSLISRPSVMEIVKMGILPLVTTVSSYMICCKENEELYKKD